MAGTYAAFMSEGTVCSPVTVIKAVRDDTGDQLPVPDPGCHRAIDPAAADTVANVIKEPFDAEGTLGPSIELEGTAKPAPRPAPPTTSRPTGLSATRPS